jgi:hypothetical protein
MALPRAWINNRFPSMMAGAFVLMSIITGESLPARWGKSPRIGYIMGSANWQITKFFWFVCAFVVLTFLLLVVLDLLNPGRK